MDGEFRTRLLRYVLRLPTPLDTEDRRLLEDVIFPYYVAQPQYRSILFVGVDWYTRHYERAFFGGKDFWTLDMRARARKFGGRRHVTCTLQDAPRHFAAGCFDLIICNGVYGHGLNAKDACESAFQSCLILLRAGGQLVLGWNDIPERDPVPLRDVESLTRFAPCEFPPLHSQRYVTNTPYRHAFAFFTKPPGG